MSKQDRITIYITDSRPVRVSPDLWPVVAEADVSTHDGGEFAGQANRIWTKKLKLRQHADGRRIAYVIDDYTSCWQGESGHTNRSGLRIDADDDRSDEQAIIDAADLHGSRWYDCDSGGWLHRLQQEAINDLPAIVLE